MLELQGIQSWIRDIIITVLYIKSHIHKVTWCANQIQKKIFIIPPVITGSRNCLAASFVYSVGLK